MEIEYNGVKLEMTELVECQRDAVYDPSGTDLLYVRWRIGCVCTLASGGYPTGMAVDWADKRNQLTNTKAEIDSDVEFEARDGARGKNAADYSWDSVKQPHNVNPTEQRNQAFLTDHELRIRLMTPRRHLKITAFNPNGVQYVWVESPRELKPQTVPDTYPPLNDSGLRNQVRVDADNGPKPIKCDIVQPAGEANTFGIHFVIETCIPPTGAASERLVLSHRWQLSHSHDTDYYLTRVITGEVRFNGTVMYMGNNTGDQVRPDWLVSEFFHPIPLGFRRNGPSVALSPDGLTLHYEVVDTDPTVTFDPGESGATTIAIAENVNYLNRGLWVNKLSDMGAGAARGAVDLARNGLMGLRTVMPGFKSFLNGLPGRFSR